MSHRPAGFSRLPLEEEAVNVSVVPSAKQKLHHAQGATRRRLKQIGQDDDGMPSASA
jgi:hypothetical protein